MFTLSWIDFGAWISMRILVKTLTYMRKLYENHLEIMELSGVFEFIVITVAFSLSRLTTIQLQERFPLRRSHDVSAVASTCLPNAKCNDFEVNDTADSSSTENKQMRASLPDDPIHN